MMISRVPLVLLFLVVGPNLPRPGDALPYPGDTLHHPEDAFSRPAETHRLVVRSGRQIQPLACQSRNGDQTGVCMFAWNCVKAGGKHLGTCIDRFYFGSCCLVPTTANNNTDTALASGVS